MPHPDLILLATDPALKLQATPIPEEPGANLRTGGGLGLPPIGGFTSPALSLNRPPGPWPERWSRSITPDSRLSRRPDALPVLSGEIDYAGGFGASDGRDQLFYKPLIGLGFVSERTGIEGGLSP